MVDRTVTNFADELIQKMPEPRVAGAEDSLNGSDYSDLKDHSGKPFDPSIHAVDSSGKPLLDRRGRIKKKPGPRAKAGASYVASEEVKSAQDARATGVAAAQATFMTCRVLLGEEWQPIVDEANKIDEPAMMSNAYAVYFEAKGIRDLPPGIVLAIALLAYAAPRFNAPVTKSRLSRAWGWVKSKLRFGRRRSESPPVWVPPSESQEAVN